MPRDLVDPNETPAFDELNSRQQKFVMAYSQGAAASAAYVQAGYSARGNSAEVNASRLLKDAKICSALAELAALQKSQYVITCEDRAKVMKTIMESKKSRDCDKLKAVEISWRIEEHKAAGKDDRGGGVTINFTKIEQTFVV
ncbi:MAG: terminase small subunit [Pseudomonadota bacterium]